MNKVKTKGHGRKNAVRTVMEINHSNIFKNDFFLPTSSIEDGSQRLLWDMGCYTDIMLAVKDRLLSLVWSTDWLVQIKQYFHYSCHRNLKLYIASTTTSLPIFPVHTVVSLMSFRPVSSAEFWILRQESALCLPLFILSAFLLVCLIPLMRGSGRGWKTCYIFAYYGDLVPYIYLVEAMYVCIVFFHYPRYTFPLTSQVYQTVWSWMKFNKPYSARMTTGRCFEKPHL